MRVKSCDVKKSICSECGFLKDGGTKDTLYQETFEIMENGAVFPCHKVLREATGSNSFGAETLEDVQVCRGYVAYMLKNKIMPKQKLSLWFYMLSQIDGSELENIHTKESLIANHKALREHIKLGN